MSARAAGGRSGGARGASGAVRVVIAGACGRMGQAIARCALQDGDRFAVAAALEAVGHEQVGRAYADVLGRPVANGLKVVSDPRTALQTGDVLIDFSSPEATIEHLLVAKQAGTPAVIGTTGLSETQLKTLRESARSVPVVFSPNMSLGVNVLFELAALAAERLGLSYDVEVVEAHHRHKKDSPSGTAKRLVEALAAARKQKPSDVSAHAVRAGDIVGDHTVILAGPAERLELTHRAHSREVFAQGALRAAAWVVRQKPGLYDMSHVLKAAS